MNAPKKCADCGFLALRKSAVGEDPVYEVNRGTRKTGARPNPGYEARPYCFVEAIEIHKLCVREDGGGEEAKTRAFRTTIHAPRDECQQFCEYVPMKSPAEHAEMIAVERLWLEQLKHADEQRERDLDRARRDKEAEDAKEDAKEENAKLGRKDEAKETSWRNAKYAIVVALLAGILTGIVALVIDRLKTQPSAQTIIIQVPSEPKR